MNTGTDKVTLTEAADLLHSDSPYVLALILRGELKAVGPGPEIFLSRTAVQQYLATHPRSSVSLTRADESIVWH